jgi:rhodanese-related sulfurtransferase
VQLNPSLAGRSVLFWATKPAPGMLSIKDAKRAYGDFSNSGVSYVRQDGSVVFKLGCPQVYSVVPFGKQVPRTFPRHVHWMISDTDKKQWLEPVMTTNILCGTSKDQVSKAIRHQTAFVVNALSSAYHAKLSIPGTCSIGHERAAGMSPGRLCAEVKRKMERQIPDTLLKTKQSYSDLPIIMYCAHRECKAAKRLAGHLLRAGFTNLYYYKDGLMGWFGADAVRDAFSH